jgi:hypothetical protein
MSGFPAANQGPNPLFLRFEWNGGGSTPLVPA